MLSNHQKCSLRDRELLRLLSQAAYNTEQIHLLLFKDNAERITQRRLKILTDRKVIKRGRLSIDEPYFYYADRKPGQVEHVLGVSWIYTWVRMTLKQHEKLHSFEREVKYKTLRADALMAVKNQWYESMNFFFFEFHVVESGNEFDKVLKYNSFYENEEYKGTWWGSLAKRFPAVIVVTTGDKQSIHDKIKIENKFGLEFRVYTLEEIKEECFNGRSGSKSVRAK